MFLLTQFHELTLGSLAHHLSSRPWLWLLPVEGCWTTGHQPPQLCSAFARKSVGMVSMFPIYRKILAQHFQTFFTIFSYGFEVWSMLDTSSLGELPRTGSLMISSHEQCESEHYFRFRSHWTKFLLDSLQEFLDQTAKSLAKIGPSTTIILEQSRQCSGGCWCRKINGRVSAAFCCLLTACSGVMSIQW